MSDGAPSVWRVRAFRLLFTAQLLNVCGDVAMFLVLAVWTKEVTGSNQASGALYATFMAPLLVGPLVGVLVDRGDPRRTVVGTDSVLGTATLLFLAFGAPRGGVWRVFVMASLYGFGSVIYSGARAGVLRRTVPVELLAPANGLLTAAEYGMQVAAPALGIALYGRFGLRGIAVMDAATFFASALLVSQIALPHIETDRRPRDFIRELREAFSRLFRHSRALRAFAIGASLAFGVVGVLDVASLPMIQFGLHRSPRILGVLLTAKGFAVIVGGITSPLLIRRYGELLVVGVAMFVLSGSMSLCISPTDVTVMLGMVVYGLAIGWAVSSYATFVQRSTPVDMLGRTMTAVQSFSAGLYVIEASSATAVLPLAGFRGLVVVAMVESALLGVFLLSQSRRD